MIIIQILNFGSKENEIKSFEVIPSLNIAYGVGMFCIGVFWLSFGIEIKRLKQ